MSTQPVDLILSAPWVLPINSNKETLTSTALVIDQGIIIDILPIKNAVFKYQAKHSQLLDNHVLMPGLVNAHGHAAMSLLRGYADDLPLMEWLEQHIWPVEAEHVDNHFVQHGSELAMAEMLRSGTTCFSDMYFFPEEAAQAIDQAGMRAQLAFPVFNVPSAWGSSSDEYIHKGLTLLDTYRKHDLIHIAFGPHAPYTTDDDTLTRIATLSHELDCPVQMHVHETEFEVSQALSDTGERPIARLERLRLLSPRLQAVHCTQLNDKDIESFASHGVHVIHCPESNLKLASGLTPIQSLRSAGINVGLGTDGAASNNDLDLFSEMRSASLLAKVVAQDSTAVTAHEALEMATINGAKALGIDDLTGSLEIGKCADIIAIDLDRPEALPVHQLDSLLAYSNCASWVDHVWVNGQPLMADRTLLTLDEAIIKQRAKEWQSTLSRTP
ncbi:MAG: TRZ/ATZ family hydrolase, partial [Pseudomonadota bacterium]